MDNPDVGCRGRLWWEPPAIPKEICSETCAKCAWRNYPPPGPLPQGNTAPQPWHTVSLVHLRVLASLSPTTVALHFHEQSLSVNHKSEQVFQKRF
jgi:hypothetical protein